MLHVAGVDVKGRRATGARTDCRDIIAGVSRRADCESIMFIVQSSASYKMLRRARVVSMMRGFISGLVLLALMPGVSTYGDRKSFTLHHLEKSPMWNYPSSFLFCLCGAMVYLSYCRVSQS